MLPVSRQKTVGLVSLGCPKATVDSERILTQLRANGYVLSGTYAHADVVIVNTCGFIDAAIEESLEAIEEAMTENGQVIVTGCLGARRDLILEKFPKVLAITGPHAADEVMALVREHLPSPSEMSSLSPVRLTPAHTAYLKISEGCNHRCTFCIIPSLRGPLISRTIDEILTEAIQMRDAGVKEILLVSQDTGAYGTDIRPSSPRLFDLCKELGPLGLWVRLHYVYPYPNVDDLLPLMADGKILPYLDVPFQHANPRLLKLMKRPGDVEKTLNRIALWRAAVPDLTIRSTFITGFPGETDAEFDELLQFLDAAQLDRVGAFAYSPVEGAAANALPGALPESVREERRQYLMQHQEDISAARLEAKIGRKMQVLVEEVDEEGATARSMGDAPDIDGLVYITDGEDCSIGEFAEVVITDSDVHDLYAKLARDEHD
ncbi:MAG: 30S ribosomal protein S12 methylthiotransferase RimO [Rhodocyclaceae bacterium]|nr:30S ribosomal protein S12 methylthiotransferase RimO [Rhodocyclaceae bacterium]